MRRVVPERFQGSPSALDDHDGETIWRAILAHEDGVRSMAGVRSPERVDEAQLEAPVVVRRHAETQALLAEFGLATGCRVWIPKNDRPAVGRANATIPERLLAELPFVFAGKAQQVVENIDVIRFQGDAVAATFEVEETTLIYSGLLRMSDLVALMPNLNFPMYIVAPESRRTAVKNEIVRPTFAATKAGYIQTEAIQRRRATLGDDTLPHVRPGIVWTRRTLRMTS